MTTGATGQLGLALPVQGELSGTWGDTVNNGITQYTNIAIAGTLTLTGDGAVTLANTTGDASASNITSTLAGAGTVTAQFAIVRVTGTLTVAKVVTGPSYSKTYTVVNAATGGIVTFKASGQTGVSVAVGETAFVYFNGTDYVKVVGTATAGAAGGSNTQVQFNSSGILAGSANMTFNGTTLTVNDLTDSSLTATRIVFAGTAGNLNDSANLTWNGTSLSATQIDITAQGPLRLQDTTGGEYVGLRSPATLGASYTLTFPADDGTSGQALITDGSGVLSWSTAASGDVYGPASATDNALARFDGTTGKIIQDSVVIVSDTGAVTGVTDLSASGSVTLSGGTANGVTYLNGSKVLTSGSALTFDGTNLSVGAQGEVRVYNTANTRYGRFLTSSQGTLLQSFNGSGEPLILDAPQSSAHISFNVGSTEGFRLTSTSLYTASGVNVAIGTSSPFTGARLTIQESASNSTAIAMLNRNSTQTWRVTVDAAAVDDKILAFIDGGSNAVRLALTDTGNLGLGVTPSAWNSGYAPVFENRGGAVFAPNTTQLQLVANAYLNSAAQWIRRDAGYAALYNIGGGEHGWNIAGTSTAGSTISFTQAMTLDASGNLGVGATSGFNALSGTETTLYVKNSGGNVASLYLEGGRKSAIYSSGAGALIFYDITGAKSMGQFDSSGNFLVGTTTATNNLRLNEKLAIVHAGSGTYAGMAITGYSGTSSGARPLFEMQRSRGTTDGSLTKVEADDVIGSLIFRGSDGSAFRDVAEISVSIDGATGASDVPGRITFATSADGSSSPTERARITAAGYFKQTNDGSYGGNPTSQTNELNQSIDNNALVIYSSNASLSTSGVIFLQASRNTTNNSFYPFSYYNAGAGAYKFRIADSGSIGTLGSIALGSTTPPTSGIGVQFPATQSASSDANTLDDYEEGVWVPAFTFSTSGSVTYTVQSGYYRKVGSLVFVECNIIVASVSSPTGDVTVNNLPFPVKNQTENIGSLSMGLVRSLVNAKPNIRAYCELNSTKIIFPINDTVSGSSLLQGADLQANTLIYCSGCFITD